MLFSKFNKILFVFALLVFGLIFTFAALVDTTQPHHGVRQLAYGATAVTNTSGVLLPAYGGTGVSQCDANQIMKWNSVANSWVCSDSNFSVVKVDGNMFVSGDLNVTEICMGPNCRTNWGAVFIISNEIRYSIDGEYDLGGPFALYSKQS